MKVAVLLSLITLEIPVGYIHHGVHSYVLDITIERELRDEYGNQREGHAQTYRLMKTSSTNHQCQTIRYTRFGLAMFVCVHCARSCNDLLASLLACARYLYLGLHGLRIV